MIFRHSETTRMLRNIGSTADRKQRSYQVSVAVQRMEYAKALSCYSRQYCEVLRFVFFTRRRSHLVILPHFIYLKYFHGALLGFTRGLEAVDAASLSTGIVLDHCGLAEPRGILNRDGGRPTKSDALPAGLTDDSLNEHFSKFTLGERHEVKIQGMFDRMSHPIHRPLNVPSERIGVCNKRKQTSAIILGAGFKV